MLLCIEKDCNLCYDKTMKKKVVYQNKNLYYDLVYKRVKNINLRIRQDGAVTVSANKGVPEAVVEAFVLSRAEWIFDVLEKCQSQKAPPLIAYFSEEEVKALVLSLCKRVYPYYEARGISFPTVKFRRMTSCWGNCRPKQGVLTFSTNLMYVPRECVEYVVWHEFTHFLQANHSKLFYDELVKVCPDWKERRGELKAIVIPRGQ